MNINQAKLKKLAKITKVIVDVFFWVTVSFGVIGFLGFIATYFVPESVFVVTNSHSGRMSVSLDGMINFRIDPEVYNNLSIKPFFQTLFPMITVISVMLVILLHQLRAILKTVSQDTPFEKNNPKRMMIIGITLLIGSFVIKYAEGMLAITIVSMLKLNDIDVNISPDGTMIFVGFLVLVLAGVFQYGNYLQEEYDATL